MLYRRIAMIQAQAHFSIVKRRQECHDFAIVPSGAPRYTGDKEYASLHRQKLIVDALMILRIIICCRVLSLIRQQHNNHHHQHKKNNTTEHSIIIVEKKKIIIIETCYVIIIMLFLLLFLSCFPFCAPL